MASVNLYIFVRGNDASQALSRMKINAITFHNLYKTSLNNAVWVDQCCDKRKAFNGAEDLYFSIVLPS